MQREATEPPLTTTQREKILRSARQTLADCLSESYWRSIRSCYRRYRRFKENWEKGRGRISHDMAIILWTAKLRCIDSRTRSTALQYTVNIGAALKRYEGVQLGESQELMDYRRGLKKQGALRAQQQKPPATAPEVEDIIEAERRSLVQLAISICWAGAARLADVRGLLAKEVRIRADGVVAVQWCNTKGDPWKLGRFTGLELPPKQLGRLRRLLSSTTSPLQCLFEGVSYHKVARAVKRINPALTPHSLRRGAIHHLALQGTPLDDIQTLSRHATKEAMLRYCPTAALEQVSRTAATSRKMRGTGTQ